MPGAHAAQQRHHDRIQVLQQINDIAADQEGHASADERADRVDGHRAAEFFPGEHVAEHRIGRRRQRRLADAHANPCQEHVQEVLADPAHCRGQAPERHAHGDDFWPREFVGQQGDGHAHEGIEQRKRQPVQ
ncbi:hypothetical protein D3C81_1617910 [compost metagenome]